MIKVFIFLVIFLASLKGHQNSIGVGTIYSQSPYIESNNRYLTVPIINWSFDKLYLRGIEIGYQFCRPFTILIQPRLNSYEISGMVDKDFSVDWGFRTGYRTKDAFMFELKYLSDLLSVHNGYEISLKFSKTFINYPMIFIPYFGVELLSENLSNYYYGVSREEERKTFFLTENFNYFLGFVSVYNFNDNYAVSLIHKSTFLSKQITNSPIIERGYKGSYIFSLVRKF